MTQVRYRSRFYVGGKRWPGIWTVRVFRWALTLKGPRFTELFSERNRRGVLVLPIGRGWRVNIRRFPA